MRTAKFALMILLVFVGAGRSFAQAGASPKIPDTAAGRQCAAWLEAFNSGDRDKLQKYLAANDPDHAKDVDVLLDFRKRVGGFDFIKAEESTETKLKGLLKERGSDQFARFELTVDAAPPNKIKDFPMGPVNRPAEFALPRLSEADALAAVRAEVEKRTKADQFSGAVAIAKNGTTILSEASGMAEREKKIPNTVETKFRIGSMNKMFTATAILQLEQAGKLKLTETVGTYLTDYPNKDLASKVTIHHLLTHTGGAGNIFGPEFDKHRLELKTLQDYVKLYGSRGLDFEPGSKWDYSNYGFLLLGVIVEKVSGENYYDYVSKHIFAPAGMNSTGSVPEEQAVEGRSVGYMDDGNRGVKPNVDTLPYRGTSAGGGYSTVGDLVRFANALESGKLLDAAHVELLTKGKVDARGSKYAYGFVDEDVAGVRCFGHGGGAPGMNGDLKICPGPGYVIAVLANLNPPAASKISNFVAERLPAK
jgi:D-alanyl-D-alanine carboxypeptidase